MRKTIIRDQLTDPRFYAEMSKLLDDLIQQSRSDAAAYSLVEEGRRAGEADGQEDTGAGIPASLHGKPEATVIYSNLYDILAGDSSGLREESPFDGAGYPRSSD